MSNEIYKSNGSNTVITVTGKGGVGKSTTVDQLATALAVQTAQPVTVVEMDEQGSISRRRGIKPTHTIADVLLGKVDAITAQVGTDRGYYLIGADASLEDAVRELDRPGKRNAVMILKAQLAQLTGIVLIDTLPQQADFCTESALCAADYVIGVTGPDGDELAKVEEIAMMVGELGALGVQWLGTLATKGVSTAPGSRAPVLDRCMTAQIESRPDWLGTIKRRRGVNAASEIAGEYAALAPSILAKIQGGK